MRSEECKVSLDYGPMAREGEEERDEQGGGREEDAVRASEKQIIRLFHICHAVTLLL